MFKNKNILVTGGTGLIGRPLVDKLISLGANVTVISLDDPTGLNKKAKFKKLDLRYFENCLRVTKNKQIVFHLAGIKGSPQMTQKKPASFLTPTVMFTFNMLEAARQNNVNNFLLTSSVGVYSPAKKFKEDDVWKTFPSKNDWYSGWGKRICELQAQAINQQFKKMKINIVRPANVFGPYDNFDSETAMVIPSLISKISLLKDGDVLSVWGDGSPIRDFVFSSDVADAMIQIMKKKILTPINIGSGKGYKIKRIVSEILSCHKKDIKIHWDTSKPSGDKLRIMDTNLLNKNGINLKIGISKGIKQTYLWYVQSTKKQINSKYNSFKEF